MKKIGLVGGTFNPPHYGHLLIASEIKEALGLDEMHFLPAAQSPFKDKNTRVTDEHRLDMLKLALQELPQSSIETIELERGGVSYTFDTVKELVETHEETEYFFLIGADQVEKLRDWYKIDELVNLVTIVAVPRPGYSLQTDYPVRFVTIPQLDVSSTELRRRLQEGISTRFLMPQSVAAYCEKEGLYVEPK